MEEVRASRGPPAWAQGTVDRGFTARPHRPVHSHVVGVGGSRVSLKAWGSSPRCVPSPSHARPRPDPRLWVLWGPIRRL